MVGRTGDERLALLLAGYTSARRRFDYHPGGEASNRWLGISVSVTSSTYSFAAGGDLTDSGLGSDDGAPNRFADLSAELGELRRACACSRPATRQHLGCLRYQGPAVVFGVRGRIGAVVWAGLCIRG